jgi:hypothetical protein
MDRLHVLGRKRLGSFDALKKATGANIRNGKFEENGYKYLPEGDLSIQGVPANDAWENSFRLAKLMCVPIKVTFEWRDKDGAAHPGRTGVIEWTPDRSGEGLRRAFGAWAEDSEELDSYLEWNRQQRKIGRPELEP